MNTKPKKTAAARRLEKLSIHYHLRYSDLAKLTGVSQNTLYRVTSGDKEISPQTAARIADALKQKKGWAVNRDWLATGSGEMLERPENDAYNLSEQPTVESAAEDAPHVVINYRERYYDLLAEFIELQRKYTALLEKLSR